MKKIVLLFLLSSCSMSEVLEMPKPRTKADTLYIPREVDTLKTSDVPIGFEVEVDEWEDEDIDINL